MRIPTPKVPLKALRGAGTRPRGVGDECSTRPTYLPNCRGSGVKMCSRSRPRAANGKIMADGPLSLASIELIREECLSDDIPIDYDVLSKLTSAMLKAAREANGGDAWWAPRDLREWSRVNHAALKSLEALARLRDMSSAREGQRVRVLSPIPKRWNLVQIQRTGLWHRRRHGPQGCVM